MEDLLPVYTVLLGSSPMFVATIVGIVMSALYWARVPRAALLVLVACVLEILLIFASAAVSGWYVPHAMRDNGAVAIQHVMMFWGVFNSLLHAVVFGLLVWAAFAGRGHSAPTAR